MAVAYESVATTAFAGVSGGGSFTISKPSGLSVGDLMICHITLVDNTSTGVGDFPGLGGFTSLINTAQNTNTNSWVRSIVGYKFADSSDVSASNFSFEKDATSANAVGGAIFRISGAASVTGVGDVASSTTTPTFSNSGTPTVANSLLLFLISSSDSAETSGSVSGYSIATSNPTWTERYEFIGNLSSDRGIMASATATRPETTATGTSTCTLINYDQNHIGVMIIVTPITNATVSPSVIVANASIQAPSVAGDANITVSVIVGNASVQAPTISTPAPDWTNYPKSTPGSTTNLPKT